MRINCSGWLMRIWFQTDHAPAQHGHTIHIGKGETTLTNLGKTWKLCFTHVQFQTNPPVHPSTLLNQTLTSIPLGYLLMMGSTWCVCVCFDDCQCCCWWVCVCFDDCQCYCWCVCFDDFQCYCWCVCVCVLMIASAVDVCVFWWLPVLLLMCVCFDDCQCCWWCVCVLMIASAVVDVCVLMISSAVVDVCVCVLMIASAVDDVCVFWWLPVLLMMCVFWWFCQCCCWCVCFDDCQCYCWCVCVLMIASAVIDVCVCVLMIASAIVDVCVLMIASAIVDVCVFWWLPVLLIVTCTLVTSLHLTTIDFTSTLICTAAVINTNFGTFKLWPTLSPACHGNE